MRVLHRVISNPRRLQSFTVVASREEPASVVMVAQLCRQTALAGFRYCGVGGNLEPKKVLIITCSGETQHIRTL